jgi:uracil-DNA glycosylase
MSVLDTVDLEQVKLKLYDKLKPSGWGDKLKTFIMSSDFDRILNLLLAEARDGKRFTPGLKDVFRAFEECNYKSLKVVILGQDPYPQLGISDGIAFSCSKTEKVQPSLKFIFKELEDTVYPGGYKWDPDLKRWSNQGVLLLNTALTTTLNKIGVHYALWDSFITFLIDLLNYNNPGLVYVFMGKVSQQWMDSVSDTNHKFITSHPASAAHNNDEKWDSKDVFRKVNQVLMENNNQEIIW